MILTKAFYRAFAVIAFGVGALGVVITVNDFSMILLGAPLMLIGFVCAVKCATVDPADVVFNDDAGLGLPNFNKGDLRDTNFLSNGEMQIIDQMTGGEGRFADTN